ncbi:MAG: hypothetical protein QW251_04770 [Desulfurococcaceae archaeon]
MMKELIVPSYYLLKFVNIIDENEKVLSYSYTPLYKFKFSTKLLVDEKEYVTIEPIVNIDKVYIYELENGFNFVSATDLKMDKLNTVLKPLNINETTVEKNENEKELKSSTKVVYFNNILDLQIKIIDFVNRGILFEVKNNKIKNNINCYNFEDKTYKVKVKQKSVQYLTEKEVFYRLTYEKKIILCGFLLFN